MDVIAPSGCSWTAVSNDGWITITSGSSGSGNGTVSYSVTTTTSSRTGTMTIAGKTFTVTQTGTTTSQTFTLTVTTAGTGSGTVTSSPAGINCGTDCTESYSSGTVVTLTATPASGSTFAGWGGDSDCSDGQVTMTANKTCTATFNTQTSQTFTLTVTTAGTGSGTVTSSPQGINCGSDCIESYNSGTVVILTATADSGSTFDGWGGDSDCTDGSVTMTADKTCTATFSGPTSSVPVVLVHGWCGSPSSTFGMMGTFLSEDLSVAVESFDYSSASGFPDSIREDLKKLAAQLAIRIQSLAGPDGEVDVVAHSMGGLLARAWMAGLATVPYSGEIRRLVTAGTPHFGVNASILDKLADELWIVDCKEENDEVQNAQAKQIYYGSQFLKELNEKWEGVVGQPVFPKDILTIAGCTTDDPCLTDGLVPQSSATLPLESPDDYVVRYVSKGHSGMVEIEEKDDVVYQLVLQFLKDEEAVSDFNPTVEDGLVVVPLIANQDTQDPFTETLWVKFGKRIKGTPSLPNCEDATTGSPFRAESPFDDTGWWTFVEVLDGCWVVQVTGWKYSAAEQEVNVTAGRPTIADPLLVVPK